MNLACAEVAVESGVMMINRLSEQPYIFKNKYGFRSVHCAFICYYKHGLIYNVVVAIELSASE